MSSALPLIIFGNIYFISNASVNAPNGFNLVSNVTQELTTDPPEPITRVATVRRDDYTYTPGIGGHKVHNLATTWNDARSICREEGGDLAIINSKAEAKIIVQLVKASGPHHGSDFPNAVLIGFHDLFVEGQYETVDGKRLSDAGFDEWADGEPNASWVGVDDCGTILLHNGKLQNGSCTYSHAFVCELPGLTEDTISV